MLIACFYFLSLGGAITPKGFSTDCGCFKPNLKTGSHSFEKKKKKKLEIPGIIGLHHPKPLPRDLLVVPRHWIWKLYILLYFWINRQTKKQKKKTLIALALAIDCGHPPAIAPNLLWPQGLWPFWRPLQTDTWKEGRGQRGLPSGGDWNQKPHQVRLWSHFSSCWQHPQSSSGAFEAQSAPPVFTPT